MQTTKLSVDEFVAWATLPEHEDRLFELIDGEIIEVSPGRTRTSEMAARIIGATYLFCHAGRGVARVTPFPFRT